MAHELILVDGGLRVPEAIVHCVGAVAFGGGVHVGVAQPEGDEVLEEVRALRERHPVVAGQGGLHNERGAVDVFPRDRNPVQWIGGAPPPRRHEEILPPALPELRVDLGDRLGDLRGRHLVEAVGGDVDHVAHFVEPAVAEGLGGGHRGVLHVGQVLEAEPHRLLRDHLRLRPDLQQVELVALADRLAQLEGELDLDGAAEADGAEAQHEGEELRQRHLAGEDLADVHLLERRLLMGGGLELHLAVVVLEDDLLAVHILHERDCLRSLGRQLHVVGAADGPQHLLALDGQGDERVGRRRRLRQVERRDAQRLRRHGVRGVAQ
mmetsp:Transcript_13381/g.30261  ORF Transcript_13381/g.30261 Transcript_13381/m.30261 type:complete len:322 (-) Transcript_13381:247-1212(-)